MSLRSYMYNAIADDAELKALGLPNDAVYATNTLDSPDQITSGGESFIVVKWTDSQSAFEARKIPSGPHLLDVWIYNNGMNYNPIDQMIQRLHALMDSIHSVDTGAGWITQIDWVGDGGDDYDDVYKAVVRVGSYRVIGSTSS